MEGHTCIKNECNETRFQTFIPACSDPTGSFTMHRYIIGLLVALTLATPCPAQSQYECLFPNQMSGNGFFFLFDIPGKQYFSPIGVNASFKVDFELGRALFVPHDKAHTAVVMLDLQYNFWYRFPRNASTEQCIRTNLPEAYKFPRGVPAGLNMTSNTTDEVKYESWVTDLIFESYKMQPGDGCRPIFVVNQIDLPGNNTRHWFVLKDIMEYRLDGEPEDHFPYDIRPCKCADFETLATTTS